MGLMSVLSPRISILCPLYGWNRLNKLRKLLIVCFLLCWYEIWELDFLYLGMTNWLNLKVKTFTLLQRRKASSKSFRRLPSSLPHPGPVLAGESFYWCFPTQVDLISFPSFLCLCVLSSTAAAASFCLWMGKERVVSFLNEDFGNKLLTLASLLSSSQLGYSSVLHVDRN